MRKELLLLLATMLLVCTAMAQADFSMDSSKEKMVVDKLVVDKLDAKNVYDNDAIREKDKYDMNSNKDGKKCFEKCYEKCFYTKKCHQCGEEHRCDSKCDKCGENSKFFKSCSSCGIEYGSENASPYCDKCGRECNWLKVCYKCGDSYQSNGYCDKCKEKCYYDKCCYTYCDKYCFVGTECKDNCPTCDEMKKQCDHKDGKDHHEVMPMMHDGCSKN